MVSPENDWSRQRRVWRQAGSLGEPRFEQWEPCHPLARVQLLLLTPHWLPRLPFPSSLSQVRNNRAVFWSLFICRESPSSSPGDRTPACRCPAGTARSHRRFARAGAGGGVRALQTPRPRRAKPAPGSQRTPETQPAQKRFNPKSHQLKSIAHLSHDAQVCWEWLVCQKQVFMAEFKRWSSLQTP